jgi:hypothetical protein
VTWLLPLVFVCSCSHREIRTSTDRLHRDAAAHVPASGPEASHETLEPWPAASCTVMYPSRRINMADMRPSWW